MIGPRGTGACMTPDGVMTQWGQADAPISGQAHWARLCLVAGHSACRAMAGDPLCVTDGRPRATPTRRCAGSFFICLVKSSAILAFYFSRASGPLNFILRPPHLTASLCYAHPVPPTYRLRLFYYRPGKKKTVWTLIRLHLIYLNRLRLWAHPPPRLEAHLGLFLCLSLRAHLLGWKGGDA